MPVMDEIRLITTSELVYQAYCEVLRPWLEADARLLYAVAVRGLRPTQAQFSRWRRRYVRDVTV